MISFLKKMFGGSEGGEPEAKSGGEAAGSENYRDCTIVATPMRADSQWRLAGRITKQIDGETVERAFIRADLFASKDEAASFSLSKGRQIIDQNPALFAPGSNENV
ncbi:HlyU family transcriptional regulator [Pararhizobium mangrovi]|uniref:Transcriptional activator HlyU n=1 Tax=Pararhizobium mangrovi TaxID=2590452 RepID=A0A506TWC1_9HYPH|nr:HlyU family transcriptional regulator [Pararhizobium mangrovi]TPW26372.1 transcriptional activator HlyU [Pararhizobium mangrovi]